MAFSGASNAYGARQTTQSTQTNLPAPTAHLQECYSPAPVDQNLVQMDH